VDSAKLKGKVVLVDFWATTCSPCVAELPKIKAAYEKFHAQGFEVIGVSCDTDKERLEKFLKRKDILWPQYFDGEQQAKNKLTQAFGIDGIPHTLLLDRQGGLRIDKVMLPDNFEGELQKLLDEK
jgi:thiol-disulfide isomerase/thioredoxin